MADLDRVRVVLVNTTAPGGSGEAARASTDTGLSRLDVVKPRDCPSAKARWRAARASDVT